MSSQKNLRTYTKLITAGQSVNLDVAGDMFAVLKADSRFTIEFDESNVLREVPEGASSIFADSYQRVSLTSDLTQLVTLVLGFGQFEMSSTTQVANVTASIESSNNSPNQTDVSLPAGVTTQVLSANANRKTITFTAGEDNVSNLRVGFNNLVNATQGAILAPAGSGEFATRTGFWVYNPSSQVETINIIELEVI